MTWNASSLDTLRHLSLDDADSVEVPASYATGENASAPQSATLTVKQYDLPENARPKAILFYCDQTSGDMICHCVRMRRMAFSDIRSAARVGAFEWLQLNVEDTANAQMMDRYKVTESPCLVFCDALGNELSRAQGAVAAGRFIELMESALQRAEQSVRIHEGRLRRLNGNLLAAWTALAGNDFQAAVRNFRSVEQQGLQARYDNVTEDARRGLAASAEAGLARLEAIRTGGAPENRVQDLATLRDSLVGLPEVKEQVIEAIRAAGQ